MQYSPRMQQPWGVVAHEQAPSLNEGTHLLIQGCALLMPDEPGRLLHNQDILLAGHAIQQVGPSGTLTYDPARIGRIIQGEGRLAIPGLVNAHTHSLENMLKATSPSLPLELWLVPLFGNTIPWSPRLAYLSALAGAIEMLKTGTTAVLDHLWTPEGVSPAYLDAIMQAYRDAGIRAAVAPSIEDCDLLLEVGEKRGIVFPCHPFIDRFSSWPPIEEQVATLTQWITTWHQAAGGRLRCLIGPSGIHWCSPSLLHTCCELAEQYQTHLHLHAVETALQASVIREVLHDGGIAYLDQMGVLKPGTSLAHAIWLEPDDLELVAKSGTTIVHNPVSNLRLGSGRFPFIDARRKGVNVALGCDGSASNDVQNMFEVLKLTGLLHNQPYDDYKKWPQPQEILEAATRSGAAAIGYAGELGELAAGQLADIVLVKLDTTAFFPLHDAYLHLVYCEHGESVDTVIVNGELVVEQGRLLTVDEQAIRTEIRGQREALWQGFSAHLDAVANTRTVLAKLDTLRRLILQEKQDE